MPWRRFERYCCVIFYSSTDKVWSKRMEPVHTQLRYGRAAMEDSLESTFQSFIVKVWVEDNAKETDLGVWHGHITHVPSGNRHYMNKLDEIRECCALTCVVLGV